jgi:SOS-response transcriptional repressor LexA
MEKNIKQLGKTQKACLRTIHEFVEARKRAPGLGEISQKTGRPGVTIQQCLAMLRERGLVAWTGDDVATLRLLPAGRSVAKKVIAEDGPGIKKARLRPRTVPLATPQAPESGARLVAAESAARAGSFEVLEKELLDRAEGLKEQAARLEAMAHDLHAMAS